MHKRSLRSFCGSHAFGIESGDAPLMADHECGESCENEEAEPDAQADG